MGKKSNIEGIIYDTIEEYTIKKFIAVGGESIVFKGEKKCIRRTYALKFRQMDKWNDFFNYEMKTLSRLEQCSTSKLAGVIPQIPADLLHEIYRMIPENKKAQCAELISPSAHYFCIVEDYIAGCDLKEYCVGNSEKMIPPHTPSVNASYEQVVDFQRKLFNWTMQFCEIMTNVSKNKFLHLDIKPENIMVSNETESITVIDFGKSMEFSGENSSVSLNNEFGDNIGVYGTNGFAPPECCDSDEHRIRFNFSKTKTGVVDVRSDIFSFGAALWDCINPQQELVIKETENGYFRRDLFNTPKGYIPELEELIIKCTEKDPNDRYQSYEELKEAAIYAEKKLLERDKPSKSLLVFSVLTGVLVFLLIFSIVINVRRSNLIFDIAKNNFSIMAEGYTEHNLSDYKETAIALIEADTNNKESYVDVLDVSYKDNNFISKSELEDVLFKCLDNTNRKDIMILYIDTIMQHTSNSDAKTNSESITVRKSLEDISEEESEGMRIAKAITNYQTDPVGSYDVLLACSTHEEYYNVLLFLDKMLLGDSKLKKQIADAKNIPVEVLDTPLVREVS